MSIVASSTHVPFLVLLHLDWSKSKPWSARSKLRGSSRKATAGRARRNGTKPKFTTIVEPFHQRRRAIDITASAIFLGKNMATKSPFQDTHGSCYQHVQQKGIFGFSADNGQIPVETRKSVETPKHLESTSRIGNGNDALLQKPEKAVED